MKTFKSTSIFRFTLFCFLLIISHLTPDNSFSKESNPDLLNNIQISFDAGMFDWKQGDDINVTRLQLGYRLPEFYYGSITFELGLISSFGGGDVSEDVSGSPINAEGTFDAIFASTTVRSSGKFYLLGKAGYGERQFTLDFFNPSRKSAQDTNTDLFIGGGFGLRPVKNIEIELNYTSFEEEQNLLSLGFNFKFDSKPSSERENWEREKTKAYKRKEKSVKKQKSVEKPKPRQKSKAIQKEKPVKKSSREAPKESVDPMVIHRFKPAPESKSTTPVEKETLDQDLPIGRSAYTAERAARMDSCRRPILYTKRNNWPTELYKAVCSDGSSRMISCEWGQCKVVK